VFILFYFVVLTDPNLLLYFTELLNLSIISRPTVSRPAWLGKKHPSGAYDRISITIRQLLVCWCLAPSLTRGRVCRLQLLLALASAVSFGSEFGGTRDHIYSLKFDTSPFVASYDSQAYGGGTRPRLFWAPWLLSSSYNPFARTKKKTPFPTVCYCIHILCHGNVFIEPITISCPLFLPM
jgi:hypothetical protein